MQKTMQPAIDATWGKDGDGVRHKSLHFRISFRPFSGEATTDKTAFIYVFEDHPSGPILASWDGGASNAQKCAQSAGISEDSFTDWANKHMEVAFSLWSNNRLR